LIFIGEPWLYCDVGVVDGGSGGRGGVGGIVTYSQPRSYHWFSIMLLYFKRWIWSSDKALSVHRHLAIRSLYIILKLKLKQTVTVLTLTLWICVSVCARMLSQFYFSTTLCLS